MTKTMKHSASVRKVLYAATCSLLALGLGPAVSKAHADALGDIEPVLCDATTGLGLDLLSCGDPTLPTLPPIIDDGVDVLPLVPVAPGLPISTVVPSLPTDPVLVITTSGDGGGVDNVAPPISVDVAVDGGLEAGDTTVDADGGASAGTGARSDADGQSAIGSCDARASVAAQSLERVPTTTTDAAGAVDARAPSDAGGLAGIGPFGTVGVVALVAAAAKGLVSTIAAALAGVKG